MIKYVIISNWSTKDQKALIAQSEADGIGKAVPRLSLINDKALLKLDEKSIGVDMVGYTKEEIGEQMDTLEWTEEPSEGGEI
jgi:hypothetical protein